MCLSRITTKRPKTAKEDIIVYKTVCTGGLDLTKVHHGMDIECTIAGKLVSGKISIYGKNVYICHNEPKCEGASALDRLGYRFSWYVDEACILPDHLKAPYRTPYREAPVVIGETYTSELIREEDSWGYVFVHKGLHSFATLDALGSSRIRVKCVIPKGSKYYVGTYSGFISYASDTLTYVELIN